MFTVMYSTWWRRRRCHRISVIDSRCWSIGRARCRNESAVTRSVTFEHCVIIGRDARRQWRRIRNWRISGWSSWRVGCVKIGLLLLLLRRMADAGVASAGCVRVVGWRWGGNRGWSWRDWRNDVVIIWKKIKFKLMTDIWNLKRFVSDLSFVCSKIWLFSFFLFLSPW